MITSRDLRFFFYKFQRIDSPFFLQRVLELASVGSLELNGAGTVVCLLFLFFFLGVGNRQKKTFSDQNAREERTRTEGVATPAAGLTSPPPRRRPTQAPFPGGATIRRAVALQFISSS